VSKSSSSTHHLHITRVGLTDVSLVITMRDNAFADVADNLYVVVVTETEAVAGRNLIVVQNDEIADRLMRCIAIRPRCEAVFCFVPSSISPADFIECFEFQHL
jgi:hypothetical protein